MSKFFDEVKQQPEAIRKTIALNKESTLKGEKPLLFTGMGSSLAASELLVSYLGSHGIRASAIDNSELLYYYPDTFFQKHDVVVTSQSGESYEAKELAKRYSVSAITNTPGSSLDKESVHAYYTDAGKEEAIASSKSFTTTVTLMLLLGSKLAGKDLTSDLVKTAEVLEENLAKADDIQQLIGSFIDPTRPLMLLGRGPSVTTTRQGSLTLKETARIYAEGMSAPLFRHGPFELLEENLQAIFFNPKGVTYERNKDYVFELVQRGAKVLYVADEPLEHENIQSVVMDSVNEYCSVIPYSFVIQMAAVILSEQRGLTAGEAKVITKITGKE
ncbi:glucosamine--fructose-6-phosphate aminotransferase (isomerizing) [Evansella vedderi]|uniref:Glutamine--fructose-6-phosphate aminotransferase [isomerizing] n=1 Tax=Evansella vedderi TaxID=38282 RepID=A0ABT9ZQ59_9BACI|nr:SIS domain-containing protein [Evansella vedderi]MDQ0252984.1 glucosamine--fructose-6-phosphate aminotransferase (isomerizing) [Evansella vedderi]